MLAYVLTRLFVWSGKIVRFGIVFGLLAGLTRSSLISRTLAHDAYIWQRDWTPALADSVGRSSDIVSSWRVLAAETDRSGDLFRLAVDWRVLNDSRLPVVLVMRINGQLGSETSEALLTQLAAVLDEWRSHLSNLSGIEIDYDCGTSKLREYALFLSELRHRSDPTLTLSITALPTWLDSSGFDALLTAADQMVLQVHAVRDPRKGLIDSATALRWVKRLADRDRKPFWVALPTYGLRVSRREDGTVFAVEAETPALSGASDATELMADPGEISELVGQLQHEAPSNLRGIVWFRLPTADDKRAWDLATWRSVISGRRSEIALSLVQHETSWQGTRGLALVNRGALDASLPGAIRLPSGCAAADGINGYSLDYRADGIFLIRAQAGLLKVGQTREIGWLRCAGDKENPRVVP